MAIGAVRYLVLPECKDDHLGLAEVVVAADHRIQITLIHYYLLIDSISH